MRLGRKHRAGLYPEAVTFAHIILLPTAMADTLLTNFQADIKGEILSLCLTHAWLSPSMVIAPVQIVAQECRFICHSAGMTHTATSG